MQRHIIIAYVNDTGMHSDSVGGIVNVAAFPKVQYVTFVGSILLVFLHTPIYSFCCVQYLNFRSDTVCVVTQWLCRFSLY